MADSYRKPDPKVPLSARIHSSVMVRLDALVRIWRKRAELRGDAFDEIDRTYVVDALLADKTDENLAEFGGLPETDAAWKTVEALLERAAHHGKHK